jgi:hypothetical protein
MKTAILTAAILLTAGLGISNKALAATKDAEKNHIALNVENKINKIEVHGNVQLYLSDGLADQVKIYNSSEEGSVSALDQNGVLNISSYQPQKLVVWVTVSDLHNLSVYDNAQVLSFGKLSSIDLEVKLYNYASAKLDMNVYAANITLNDRAKANLAGYADDVELKYNRASLLDTASLSSPHMVKTESFAWIASNL